MIANAQMDNSQLTKLIQEQADEMLEEQSGFWKFIRGDRVIIVVTDESHNRMRIITPVVAVTDLDDSDWPAIMSANFDRALDARYAINGDYLWSAFIHPLAELKDNQFVDALQQVVTLANNFGTTFSSGNLYFGE